MITIESRALYYSLRRNWEKNPDFEVEKWQVTDYRCLDDQTLYEEVAIFSPALDPDQFNRYASMFDSPEDMALFFAEDQEDNPKKVDRFYCAIFELWRRNIHDRVCVSIFCDKFDRLMDSYHTGELNDTALLDECFDELIMFLKDYSDGHESKEDVFQAMAQGCAHDLEEFIIQYISEQIDEGRREYVREWIEALSEFVDDKTFFLMLYSRSYIGSDEVQSRELLEEALEQIEPKEDLDLLIEALEIAIEGGFVSLVQKIAIDIFSVNCSIEDIYEVIESLKDFAHDVEYSQLEKSLSDVSLNLHKKPLSQDTIERLNYIMRSEFDNREPNPSN